MFAGYFAGMSFTSIQIEIMELFNLNVLEYNLLMEGSIVLSIFMSLFAGYIADKIGFRKSLVIGTIWMTFFQAVICFGIYKKNFWIVFTGKTGFGVS